MKTAMRELLDEIQTYYNDENMPSSAKEGLRIVLDMAAFQFNSIQKELEQITNAHQAGQFNADKKDPSFSEATSYFINTYMKPSTHERS